VKYVLALDQGTTSSRAILFDQEGAPLSVAQREFRQIFAQPGWVEHDPVEIFRSQREVAREALQKSNCSLSDVMAIGIANQRETTVVWDRQTSQPIHNAIVWQDRRTAELCRKLKDEGAEETIRRKTGLVIDPYFSGTKIAWILDQVPGARGRAERGELAFGTVDTWLIWQLTGNRTHVTDPSNASRTMLFDINTGDWDAELLRLLRVPRAILPDIHPSAHAFGMLPKSMFGEPLIIAGVAGDQQAALFGQACHREGMAKNTYGTGCFMLLHTGGKVVSSSSGLVSTACAQSREKEYALEGSVFIAGAVVQWLRDGLEIIRAAPDVEALAASVPHTDGVYFVPAFAGLGAPHWDQYARGTLVGLTRGTTKAHIARAALESIALQVMDVLKAMEADAKIKLKELRVDGGASANDLLMQLQANLLGVPVVRPRVSETTALGAAYLAGLAVGYWKNQTDIARQWQADKRFTAKMTPAERKRVASGWEKALGRAKGWEEG
jgi:glycerol kinase